MERGGVQYRMVCEELEGWAERYPDVLAGATVRHCGPAVAILEASESARLVVIGTRGR